MSAALTRRMLDMRVTRAGTPVESVRAMRGWFTVRRPADPAGRGVELVTRIPGYLDQVTGHATQAAAEAAQTEIYDRYSRDVLAAEPATRPWLA